MAFRSVPRPSSPPGAKASTECPSHTPILNVFPREHRPPCTETIVRFFQVLPRKVPNAVPGGSHSLLGTAFSLRRLPHGNTLDRMTHNASEPSPPDLGAPMPRFNPSHGFPGQTSTEQRDVHGTKPRFHRTRPETHQNLIHTDKEQNRHR